jgi:glycosyltransferase involved in cell wall biosynthesis
MRVLVLSQYYDPEPIPAPAAVAKDLAGRGHDVTVVTGLPNYPAGKLYPGYRARLVQRELIDGIKVIRTYEYAYHGKGTLLRMMNYLSFMCSAIMVLLFCRRFDVIYTWHPPLTIGVIACVIGKLRSTPFVYDVQDIWPDSVIASGMLRPGCAAKMMDALSGFIYRRAKHVLAVTEGARKLIRSRGVAPGSVSVMPRWVDDFELRVCNEDTRRIIRLERGWEGKFVLLFAGNIGAVQGLDTILQAAELLAGHTELLIVFAGDGCERRRLMNVVERKRLTSRVSFIGPQEKAVAAQLMQAADVNFVHLLPSCVSSTVIPTKTYSCMASGQPVLMAVDGAPAALIQEVGCGIVVDPGNAEAFAQAVQTFMAMSSEERRALGSHGNEYIHRRHRSSVVLPHMETLLVTHARGISGSQALRPESPAEV